MRFLLPRDLRRLWLGFGLAAVLGVTLPLGSTAFAELVEIVLVPQAGPSKPNVQLLDVGGQIHAIRPISGHAVRVIIFMKGECPISCRSVPTLNALVEGWRQANADVVTYGVWTEVTETAEAARFQADYGLKFPLLIDRQGELVRALHPDHVPEAFVLNSVGDVIYRGRIDDRYPSVGQRRQVVTDETLQRAVEAALAGQAPPVSRTEAVGCPISAEDYPIPETVLYTRDIAPIVMANCVSCHRDGAVGPFRLDSFAAVKEHAELSTELTASGRMPPWLPAESQGEFHDQRTLTSREKELLARWFSQGCAEGDAADIPAAPTFPTGWRLGTPDLILEMPEEFELAAAGDDVMQNFVIPTNLPTDKRVAAVEFRPGNPKIVHHALLFLDSAHRARLLDEKTPEPGYATFGGIGTAPTGSIGGWSPGKLPQRMPDNMGRFLKKGSDVVMQVHYHPSGKPEKDRSQVAVYFAEGPGPVAADIWGAAYNIDIPAGQSDYKLETSFKLASAVTFMGVVPHMHLLGRSMVVDAIDPEGKTTRLINVPHWDFNWQSEYLYQKPITLPAGTEIRIQATYDNSTANPSNPRHPPERVRFGERTQDEMCYCFFLVTTENRKDLYKALGESMNREVQGVLLNSQHNLNEIFKSRQPGTTK